MKPLLNANDTSYLASALYSVGGETEREREKKENMNMKIVISSFWPSTTPPPPGLISAEGPQPCSINQCLISFVIQYPPLVKFANIYLQIIWDDLSRSLFYNFLSSLHFPPSTHLFFPFSISNPVIVQGGEIFNWQEECDGAVVQLQQIFWQQTPDIPLEPMRSVFTPSSQRHWVKLGTEEKRFFFTFSKSLFRSFKKQTSSCGDEHFKESSKRRQRRHFIFNSSSDSIYIYTSLWANTFFCLRLLSYDNGGTPPFQISTERRSKERRRPGKQEKKSYFLTTILNAFRIDFKKIIFKHVFSFEANSALLYSIYSH